MREKKYRTLRDDEIIQAGDILQVSEIGSMHHGKRADYFDGVLRPIEPTSEQTDLAREILQTLMSTAYVTSGAIAHANMSVAGIHIEPVIKKESLLSVFAKFGITTIDELLKDWKESDACDVECFDYNFVCISDDKTEVIFSDDEGNEVKYLAKQLLLNPQILKNRDLEARQSRLNLNQ